jgi:hypothetical protein
MNESSNREICRLNPEILERPASSGRQTGLAQKSGGSRSGDALEVFGCFIDLALEILFAIF